MYILKISELRINHLKLFALVIGSLHYLYPAIRNFGNLIGMHISFGSMKVGRGPKYGEKLCPKGV